MGTMEIARFAVEEEDAAAVVAEHPAVVDALAAACPGLVGATLTRADDGSWLHVLTWRSHTEALAAAEAAPSIPTCAAWFGRLRGPRLEHAEILDARVVG
jgi:glutathione S-transferase